MIVSERAAPAIRWLAFALLTLPFWQLSGLDFDRSGALVLVGPALWLSRQELRDAWNDLWTTRKLEAALGLWLLLACLVACAFSTHSAASIVMVARWVLLGAAALLAGRLVRIAPAQTSGLWLGALALSAAAGTLTVWIYWFLGHRTPFPLYFHARHLGYHAMLAAVAAVALVARSPNRPSKIFFWLAIGTVVWAGVFWSGSRAPMLGLGVACIIFLIRIPRPAFRRTLGLTAGMAGLGLILAQLFTTAESNVGLAHAVQRTISASSAAELTSIRSAFWLSSWHHFLEAPLFGFGPDAYLFLVPKLDGPHPHNLLLQCLLDFGAIGTLPALGLLALGYYRGGKRSANVDRESDRSAWLALLTAGGILSLLDGPFYHLIGFLPLALAGGICLAEATPATTDSHPAGFSAFGATLVAVATIVLGFHTWLYFEVSFAPTPRGPDALVARVWRFFPSTTAGLRSWYADWAKDQPDAALEWTLWTADRSSDGALFRVLAARLLLVQDRQKEARRQMEIALAIAHYQQRAYIQSLLKDLFPAPPGSVPLSQ